MKTVLVIATTLLASTYLQLSAQTPDSTKADSVQKPHENWY